MIVVVPLGWFERQTASRMAWILAIPVIYFDHDMACDVLRLLSALHINPPCYSLVGAMFKPCKFFCLRPTRDETIFESDWVLVEL